MSSTRSIPKAIERLSKRDHTLKMIDLSIGAFTDAELAELVECLLANPNIVTVVSLATNKLTDETGIKLAQFVAASSTIEILDLTYNQFATSTYLAMTAALHINVSLKHLYMYDNQPVDICPIEAAFINALILNPNRSIWSGWILFKWYHNDDYYRLKKEAERLRHCYQ